MQTRALLVETLARYSHSFAPIVPFNLQGDNIWRIDLTAKNATLHQIDLTDTEAFSQYIFGEMHRKNCIAAVGGYNENRFLYHRSRHFDGAEEARTVHLGIDIWAEAGTPVSAPLPATVHSFANNNNFGDYGYTIILQHETEDCRFFTLYGHLSANSFEGLHEEKPIAQGETFAWFGAPHENGCWPPHLHFQLITDMLGKKGDFPGVCAKSQREYYLNICPNPAILLGLSD